MIVKGLTHSWLTLGLVAGIFLAACSSTSPIRSSGNAELDAVLERAYELRGTPYCPAGQTPKCFDCSGFVYYCMLQGGTKVPRTTSDLFAIGKPLNKDEIQPGDLVFFNTSGKGISHVGFYVGDGAFIHSSTSSGVIVSKLSETYWEPRYIGARRLR